MVSEKLSSKSVQNSSTAIHCKEEEQESSLQVVGQLKPLLFSTVLSNNCHGVIFLYLLFMHNTYNHASLRTVLFLHKVLSNLNGEAF